MDTGLALQEFLEFVLARLVRHPEAAAVIHEWDGKKHVYRLRSAPEDLGRIIGRHGHTISAIRSLLEAAAEKHGIAVSLKVDGDGA
jgi:predicted RNA-binding protein YlqC (UPF0109 family)